MNVVKLQININGPCAEHIPVADRNAIVSEAISKVTKWCVEGELEGVKLHVNSILEFVSEEDLTFFMLSYRPIQYKIRYGGVSLEITVKIKEGG